MALFGKKNKSENKKDEPLKKEPSLSGSVNPLNSDASYNILHSPHISEKASIASEGGSYVFKVSKKSNKFLIKEAIEKLYGVDVRRVNIVNVRPKFRRLGMHEGEKSGYKKAIVTLTKGQTIDTGSR